MTINVIDTQEQTDPTGNDSPSDGDSHDAAGSARHASNLTRRSLLKTGAIAVVGTVAGCTASGNDPDAATNGTTATTNGTTSTEGGRGVPASGGMAIRNETDVAYEVSVVVAELEAADYEALPREFTPTTSVEARSPMFRTQVRLSPDARRYHQEVFPVPDDRVAYRATVTLDDGTRAGYVFDNFPHSGFLSLRIIIWSGPDIIIGKSVT